MSRRLCRDVQVSLHPASSDMLCRVEAARGWNIGLPLRKAARTGPLRSLISGFERSIGRVMRVGLRPLRRSGARKLSRHHFAVPDPVALALQKSP